MTSLSSASTARAVQISRGAALAPRETDRHADYLRERINLLARLLCMIGAFLLLAGLLYRLVLFHAGVMAGFGSDAALYTQIGLIVAQAGVWFCTREGRWSERSLSMLDVILVVGTLSALSYESPGFAAALQQPAYLLVLLAMLAVMCRAVIVPSRPKFTLLVSCLASVPALLVAYSDGMRRGTDLATLGFCAMWCAVMVALSAFTSHVLYGLRKSAILARELGQYVLERKLGEGGMGEVYLARHALLRRPTAIKLLPPERAGRDTVARFEREVQATSRLYHPNTVAIYDYGRTRDGIFYYAMEYLDGCDLQALVKQQGPLAAPRVAHLLSQIVGALAEAHATGLVHRDLKPSNVFVCERGGEADTVKVLDFGLVKDVGPGSSAVNRTTTNALLGTPAYLSPEAIHSPAEVDARSDLYAVGAIAYFLLTGHDVFEGNSVVALCIAHLNEQPMPPSQRAGRAIPSELEHIVLWCLEKRVEDRPQSALVLRAALLDCADALRRAGRGAASAAAPAIVQES